MNKNQSANADVSQFESYRNLMFSIAYRMLGSATEAEDIIQDAYLRYQTVAPGQIISHKAFLSTVVTRLCLNRLQLAQTQRESYIGPWLPEPILTDLTPTPAQQTELHESISLAFLTMLEELTPLERAVFLLREVFDYSYAELALIVGKEETACRQIFSRAKKHITDHRARFKPTPEAHSTLMNQFITAITTGDLGGLMQILAEDVTLWADGGGKARGAALRPLYGREAVSKFLIASPRLANGGGYQVDIAEVNGEPAMILRTEAGIIVVMSLTAENGQIAAIHAVGNPDKLTRLDSTHN